MWYDYFLRHKLLSVLFNFPHETNIYTLLFYVPNMLRNSWNELETQNTYSQKDQNDWHKNNILKIDVQWRIIRNLQEKKIRSQSTNMRLVSGTILSWYKCIIGGIIKRWNVWVLGECTTKRQTLLGEITRGSDQGQTSQGTRGEGVMLRPDGDFSFDQSIFLCKNNLQIFDYFLHRINSGYLVSIHTEL